MSDDLVKRLRDGLWSKDLDDLNPWQQDIFCAADRIEQLEAAQLDAAKTIASSISYVDKLESIKRKREQEISEWFESLDRIIFLENALAELLSSVEAVPIGTIDPHSIKSARAALEEKKDD